VLNKFLDEKPLYYETIDYSRMPRVYDKIKSQLHTPKIIHLIGTNGKGTTGRFLATALHSLGYSTGHYTSPHILNFNERIWLNGEDVSDEILDSAHTKLLKILTKEDADSLSYFEYTTLLAMFIYQDLDYVVLEAGLGGEFDATAVFRKELSLVTPIDIDHQAFLGNTIREIATTKLNAVQKIAILARQKDEEVYEVARTVSDKKASVFKRVDDYIESDDELKIAKISKELSLVSYLVENLKLSISALKQLDIEYDSKNFINSRLFGRLSYISENIIVDVGHNTLAALSIFDALKGEKYILVYNSYRDKNYREILSILKPIISHIEIIKIEDERAEKEEVLRELIQDLDIVYQSFNRVDKNKKYLVFGSFSVVESFLKVYSE
jgi:dihydrofolate synthase/folylpolyglutamate synthase